MLVALLLLAGPSASLAAPAHPFGSHPMAYAAGAIRPNHVSQATLDRNVSDFWDAWKKAYVISACGDGRRVVLVGEPVRARPRWSEMVRDGEPVRA